MNPNCRILEPTRTDRPGYGTAKLSFSFAEILDRQSLPKIDVAQLQSKSLNELIPMEDDYIYPKFRAISATYLGARGYYLDFSRPAVLEKAVPLFLDMERGGVRKNVVKLHRNHNEDIQSIIGFINQAEYDPSERYGAPGINVETAIDMVIAKEEVRKLLSEPPLIDSVSLAVQFQWEQSHPDMSFWTFVDLLGREVDGEVVRLIVTKIEEIFHLGLVYEGADERAKMIEELGAKPQVITLTSQRIKSSIVPHTIPGVPRNHAQVLESAFARFSRTHLGANLARVLNDRIDEIVESDGVTRSDVIARMAREAGISVNTVEQILRAEIDCPPLERLEGFSRALDMSLETIQSAAESDGCTYNSQQTRNKTTEGTMDDVTLTRPQAFAELLELEEVDEQSLLSAVQAMAKANRELRELANIGKRYRDRLKKEVRRLAGIIYDGDVPAAQEEIIESADIKTLEFFREDFEKRVLGRYPEKCLDCGSTNIARRSSVEEPPEEKRKSEIDESHFQVGR